MDWQPELPIALRRRFQLWVYSVSMGRLVLRSFKNEPLGQPHSYEVMFQGVTALQVKSVYDDGLLLRDPVQGELESLESQFDVRPHRSTRIVMLGERVRAGWVACAAFGTAMNDRDYKQMPELLAISGLGAIGARDPNATPEDLT